MIAIVGGGIAGLSCARVLARAGWAVTLFDRAPLGAGGASSVPIAVLNPHRGQSGMASEADSLGFASFLDAIGELEGEGHDVGWHPVGVVRYPRDEVRRERWREIDGLEEIDEVEARLRGTRFGTHGSFVFARGGWIDSGCLLRALESSARHAGVVTFFSTAVVAAGFDGGRWTLETDRGAHSAEILLSCTGDRRAPWAPADDLRRLHGGMLTMEGLAVPEREVSVVFDGCYVVRSESRGFVGGGHHEAEASELEVRDALGVQAARLHPPLAAAAVVSTWRGTRSLAPGRVPRLRAFGDRGWTVEGLGGRGYLRAFSLAREVAEAIGPPPCNPRAGSSG